MSKNFKPQCTGGKLIPVVFEDQIRRGSFEFALSHLLDQLSLEAFEARYRNEACGASAYHPRVLLKIVLLAYSRGVTSSRVIEALCQRDVQFIAISGDTRPQFTTIAAFIARTGDEIAKLFTQVLLVCSMQGLIGREMFAIDGVKLPSNASKAKSGTRKEMQREAGKMRRAVDRLLDKHRTEDERGERDDAVRAREGRRIERLDKDLAKVSQWLERHPHDRRGAKGAVRKSNRTDNESAKMATSKGVIQGYTAVAAVDEKHQIIVEAQAHGVGQEQELLVPVIDALKAQATPGTTITTDSGYHSKANVKALAEREVQAYIPDHDYRKRDARYAGQHKHRGKPDPLWDKRRKPAPAKRFVSSDFRLAADDSHLVCPAGKRLYRSGVKCRIGGGCGDEVQGHQARLRELRASGPMFTPPAADRRQTGGHFHRQGRSAGGGSGGGDEAADRQRGGQGDDHASVRDGGAGVREPAAQQAAEPVHAAGPAQGRGAVEALLPGAQHREAGEGGVWVEAVKRRKSALA